MNTFNLVLKSYYPTSDGVIAWLHDIASWFNDKARPSFVGISETPKNKDTISITDQSCYKRYIEKYHGCLWLFGNGIKYSTSVHSDMPSDIHAWIDHAESQSIEYYLSIVDTWDRHGAEYGYGAHWEEYEARNGFKLINNDRVKMSGFLGRDYRTNIPGLYWINYLSVEYINEHELDIELLVSRLNNARMYNLSRGVVIVLYDSPLLWREHDDDVRRVIANTPNMFNIDSIRMPSCDMTPREELDWLDAMKHKWP